MTIITSPGPLHWHVHKTGAVQIYRNGKRLMDETLTPDELVKLARDMLLAATSSGTLTAHDPLERG